MSLEDLIAQQTAGMARRAEAEKKELLAYLERHYKVQQPNSDASVYLWALSAIFLLEDQVVASSLAITTGKSFDQQTDEIVDAFNKGFAAGEEKACRLACKEMVGWQCRWMDPEEGPGLWRFINAREYELRRYSAKYEVREVFA